MNNVTTGRAQSEKEFVCSSCYRAFELSPGTSWLSGEKMPCPFCHSFDTTPMLEVRVGGRKLHSFDLTFKEA